VRLFLLGVFVILNFSVLAQPSQSSRIEDLSKAINAAQTPEAKAPLLLQRGRIKTGMDADAAMSDIQSALSLYQQSHDEKGQVDAYLGLSMVYFRQEKHALAADIDSVALDIANKIGYIKGEAASLGNVARNYQHANNLPRAKKALLRSLELYEKEGLMRDAAEIYNRLGSLYNRMSDFKGSLEMFDKGLEIAVEKKLDPVIASIKMNKANLLGNMSQTENAIGLYLESLKIFEKMRNTSGMAVAHMNIANLYKSNNSFSSSLEHYMLAAGLSGSPMNRNVLAGIYNNMGSVYSSTGRADSMLYYYQKAFTLFQQLGDKLGESAIYFEKGNYYYNNKNYAGAIRYYDSSLVIRRKANSELNLAVTLNALGAAYSASGQKEKASLYLFEALSLSKDRNQAVQKAVFKNLAAHYKTTGNLDSAVEYQSKFISISDTTVKESDVATMLKAEQRYEIEKRESQIAMQKNQNEISDLSLKSRKQTIWLLVLSLISLVLLFSFMFYRYRMEHIKRTDKLRKRLSQDLHDDIGSTLSSINIYAELAKNETGKPHYLEAIKGHTQSVLGSLDDLVWSLQPKNDSLGNLTDRMKLFAVPLLEAKGIEANFANSINSDASISFEQRTHIYLAFKEMVNNVAKHSNASRCTMNCISDGKNYVVTVSDNGTGFTENAATNRRNGLSNLRSRAAQCHGKLNIDSIPGNGSTLSFYCLQNTINM
jgi:two-component system, NarL family, sensor histidine kinase UhpB